MHKWGEFTTGSKAEIGREGGLMAKAGWVMVQAYLQMTPWLCLPGKSYIQSFLGSHISIPERLVKVVLPHFW